MNTGYIYTVFYAESSGRICVPFRCVKPEKYGSKSCDSQVMDTRDRLDNKYSKRTSKYMYASIFHLFIYINKSIKLAVKFYNMLLRIVTTYQAIDKIEKASI